jgi:uncharacterized protein with ParB-like and HNH nuclease domain
MGNIANKIDAKDKKLSVVLFNNRYRIDPFQREYRWQRKQIEALISDLSISFLKNYKTNHTIENCIDYDCYYMGPIVLCEDGNELSIIDGQQRLTSFTLLIIYLHHAQTKLGIDEDSMIDLIQYLYVKKAGRKSLILNIDSRTKIFELLIQNPESIYEHSEEMKQINLNSDASAESIQNIIARYEDITKLLPEDINTADVLPIFIEWLLDKIVMVEVKAYSLDNAYSIFETMNDRGLTLSPTEILKGYLLNKINDEEKNEEINEFWKERVQAIKSLSGLDNSDMDFFRAWLRAKYAISIRQTKQGAENEDFELIGTNFHTWVKNNSEKTFLKQADDYYFFIRSDFDFYSNLYSLLFKYKSRYSDEFNDLYITNYYPIADSLSYPLFLSPVSKIDDEQTIYQKIILVNKYIDVFVQNRIVQGKSITQTSIRNTIYELTKTIRNVEVEKLKSELSDALDKSTYSFPHLHSMDNWGYYHYFFARILNRLGNDEDFCDLQRSRKQKSYVLVKLFQFDEIPNETDELNWFTLIDTVAGHCLIRRYDMHDVFSKKPVARIKFLQKQGYLPEMKNIDYNNDDLISFIKIRDYKIKELADEIWCF